MTVELDALRAFLRARDDADAAVGDAMRSQLLAGINDEVVLLLHGLTASPLAWQPIAADLNAGGATVISLRLPLHGSANRMTTALEGLSARGLTSDLRTVIDVIGTLGKRLVIGGHSLGGTLAVHAAAMMPSVERVVAIAPFLGVAGLPHEAHGLVVPFLRRLPNVFLWWDPVERERQQPAHGYPRYPLHAIAVGLSIAERVYQDAGCAPAARSIDLVVNAQESSVNNRAVRRLAQRWRRTSAAVAVHELAGLPPSHDIIEPYRAHSARARELLVKLLSGERADASSITHFI